VPRPLLSSVALGVLAGFASSTLAQVAAPAPAASAPTTTLAPVTVTGKADRETATSSVAGYRARNAATASKTDTPLRETPQSVSIVTRDQIVDQGATNLQDAMNYAAGVRSDAYGLDSRTDSARIRGGSPDEYLDGLRKNFEYYTSNARTDPFTLERSVRTYRINDYLHRMVEPAHRQRFMSDPEGSFADADLSDAERDLIRRRDWRGLMHYGAIFFGLEKLGAVVGVSNLHIYAHMRGQSLEEFQKTRNTTALYSVTGEAANVAWDKPAAR